ncbi:unnamed protein product [Calypogeia fissa]
MAAEKVVAGSGSGGGAPPGGGGGTSERESEEMDGSNSKVAMSGGGGSAAAAYRWNNGDAVTLKRRRVGLGNGVSVGDGGGGDSSDEDVDEEQEEQEERELEEDDEVGEDAEEVAAEEYSDDYAHNGAVHGSAAPAVEEEEEEEEAEEAEEVEEEAEEEEEPEEEEEEDDDQHLVIASMDHHHQQHRGGIGSNRGRDSRHVYEEHDDAGTEDEGYDEEEHHHPIHEPLAPVARARVVSHRERVRETQLAYSPEQVGGQDEIEESDDERVLAPPLPPPIASRGIIERGQSSAALFANESHHHQRHDQNKREVMPVVRAPEKPAKGMSDTAKRKASAIAAPLPPPQAANIVVAPLPRNGSVMETKPKKPAAPRKKANGGDGGTTTTTTGPARDRTRFSTDNKARVTLERAREILAAVKAAMMKDPKQFTVRHPEPHAAVENSSSSEDDRRRMPMQHPLQHPAAASRAIVHHQQQQLAVKTEEKVAKKRSRAAVPKGEKEPTPRRRKQSKTEVDYQHVSEEKPSYKGSRPQPQLDVYDHHGAYKMARFSASGAEQAREGREMMMEDHRSNGYSRDDGIYEQQQQITVVEKKVRKRRKAKDGEDPASATGLCPGSVIRDENWAPPASPFGLIQESLYKDPWKVLLSCMLLNKTAGRQFLVQMHKVIWDLFSLCPDAETAINMDTAKIAEKVYSLGLQNKRAKMIQRFSAEYLRGDWTNVTQLHGIGKYAADAYAIFCQGLWREVEPDDLMLNKYWKWLWETNGQGTAFVPETS